MSHPKNTRPRVARGPDKLTHETRCARSKIVDENAKDCDAWQANPALAGAGKRLIQAGLELAAGQVLVAQLEMQVQTARQQVFSLRIDWDHKFNVYADEVEIVSIKPEDVTDLGCLLRTDVTNVLAPPEAVLVHYDLDTSEIRIHVRKPPGNFTCVIEISPDPVAPGSFQALKGKGARHALEGYPPGGYWVRAAIVGDKEVSAYSDPVFVTVR